MLQSLVLTSLALVISSVTPILASSRRAVVRTMPSVMRSRVRFFSMNGDLAKCPANFDRRLGTESFLPCSMPSVLRHETRCDIISVLYQYYQYYISIVSFISVLYQYYISIISVLYQYYISIISIVTVLSVLSVLYQYCQYCISIISVLYQNCISIFNFFFLLFFLFLFYTVKQVFRLNIK